MTSRSVNATAMSLLGFLHEGPMTGWDLVATAQRRIGNFWSVTQSQVYRELSSMAQLGFVEAGEVGARDARPYSITDAGRAAFREWLASEPGNPTIRFPLLLTVLFGRYLPDERLRAFLDEHRAVHARAMDRYEDVLAKMISGEQPSDKYAIAVVQFGMAYERALLDWFTNAAPALTEDSATD